MAKSTPEPLKQPGAKKEGPIIDLNDRRYSGDGHWLTQKKKAKEPKK